MPVVDPVAGAEAASDVVFAKRPVDLVAGVDAVPEPVPPKPVDDVVAGTVVDPLPSMGMTTKGTEVEASVAAADESATFFVAVSSDEGIEMESVKVVKLGRGVEPEAPLLLLSELAIEL